MYIKLALLLIVFISFKNYAQFGEQQIITDQAKLARDVFTADIDGDGDKDVLTASRSNGGVFSIAWFENIDGLGFFGNYNLIDDNSIDPYSVYAADLDNDDDIDVLATAGSNDQVFWYKNLDGLGNFSSRIIIGSNLNGAYTVIASDIDNDGNIDVFCFSTFDNKIVWFKNDGLGNFGNEQIISYLPNGRSIKTADIDGDGDLDLLASSSGNVIVYWFENLDGLGNFSTPKVIAPVAEATSTQAVFAIDIDGDLDLDVLAIPANKRVVWFENLDGEGTFGAEQVITTGLISSYHVFSADLDNDGDNDVLYTSTPSAIENTSEIGWCENLDGLGNFGQKQVIINTLIFATKVYSTDIDDDGDMDVFSVSQNDDTIAWYENFTILGVEDITLDEITLYPNPTKNTLQINSNDIVIKNITIYDILGKKVFVKKGDVSQINMASLSSGLYLVKIQTASGVLVKKVMKE